MITKLYSNFFCTPDHAVATQYSGAHCVPVLSLDNGHNMPSGISLFAAGHRSHRGALRAPLCQVVDLPDPLGAALLHGSGMAGSLDCDAGHDGGARGLRDSAAGEEESIASSVLGALHLCDSLCLYCHHVLLAARAQSG